MKSYDFGSVDKKLEDDIKNHGGWIVGHFIENELRKTNNLEVKWHRTKKGEFRNSWSVNELAQTLCFLISGKMKFILPDETIILSEGDYFISNKNIPHKTEYLEDSLTITVRWPSIPGDHKNIL